MTPEQELIASLTEFSKYARYWTELNRRETYAEIVARNRNMHLSKIAQDAPPEGIPKLEKLIDEAYLSVLDREVFPSMRSYQFGGEAILANNTRVYNCAYRHADDEHFFSELMYLLLCGTGVGYSVRREHVASIPARVPAHRGSLFTIPDSIEGWALAVDELVTGYLVDGVETVFDYSLIRPRGSLLKTSGGRAPGPEPLRKTLEDLRVILERMEPGQKLGTLQVHDMATIIARAVLSGGIRRSAMIALFSPDDEDMLTCKTGEWYKDHGERAYANNSAVLLRGRDDDLFHEVFRRAKESGSGEPGVYWVDDEKYGTNPCAEITLNHKQFCNLSTINVGTVLDQHDFNQRARAAAIIGTLQASYTDYPFLSPEWKRQTEAEALLGVSMTGIASGAIDGLDAAEAAAHAVAANKEVAALLGINPAARVTAIKPEGTASLVAGTSSGIHAWHDKYFIRRMRFNKVEPIAQYLMERLPYRIDSDPNNPEIVEDDVFNSEQIVVAIPVEAPEGAATRTEGAMAILERVKRYQREWIRPGNEYGGMTNNISATINIQDHEWEDVYHWMWNNRYEYNGLSILPYSDHTYVQAPYETIDQATFEVMSQRIRDCNVDLSEVVEFDDNTAHAIELACSGGACEWNP